MNLLKSLKLTAKIGFFNYILYKLKPLCRFNIENCEVFVRRGSPDLRVALTSLSGEFRCLENLLPKNFDGLIVDAGAYIGTASIALHKLYPKASIFAIKSTNGPLLNFITFPFLRFSFSVASIIIRSTLASTSGARYCHRLSI